MVEGIDDEEVASVVEGERVWGEEFAWLGTLAGLQAAEEFAARVELLNATVDRRAPNVVVWIDGDADGAFEVRDFVFEAGELTAEATGFIFQTAPRQDWFAVTSQLLDSAHLSFGCVEIACFVEREELWAADSRFRICVAAELAGLSTVLAELGDEFAVFVEDLDSPIRLVGDIDAIIGADRKAAREIKLALFFAGSTPLTQKLACGRIDGDAIGVLLFAHAGNGEVGYEQRAVMIGCDRSRISARHRTTQDACR